MTSSDDILALIAARRERRPARDLPFLDALFQRLAACHSAEAGETEERIWQVWMDHPHPAAAPALDCAEGWKRRATLSCRLGREGKGPADTRRTLALEPRHFCAMLHFAEILLGDGAAAEARFAFRAALILHPHLSRARAALSDKP